MGLYYRSCLHSIWYGTSFNGEGTVAKQDSRDSPSQDNEKVWKQKQTWLDYIQVLDLHKTIKKLAFDFLLWLFHDLLATFIKLSHDFPTPILWLSYDLPIIYLQLVFNITMISWTKRPTMTTTTTL